MRAFFWGLTESLFHLGRLLVDRVGLRTSAEKNKEPFYFQGLRALVSFACVIWVVTGKALRDNTSNGCEGEYTHISSQVC